MDDCIFCKIARHEIPTGVVYEDDQMVAFKDLNPHAPVHVLLIPKKHIANLLDLSEEDAPLVGHILAAAKKIAQEQGVAESGFRVVANTNADAGQSVPHLHFHLLGGRHLAWPPG